MIERLSLRDAALFLNVSVEGLLSSAVEGEIKAEVFTRKGYEEVSKQALQYGLQYGVIVIGKMELTPEKPGLSNFERLMHAPQRLIRWPEEFPLFDLQFRRSELSRVAANEKRTENKPESKKQKLSGARLSDLPAEHQLVLKAAADILKADPSLTKPSGDFNLKTVAERIVSHRERFEESSKSFKTIYNVLTANRKLLSKLVPADKK